VETLRLALDPQRLHSAEARHTLDRAAAIIRAGGLVAFPTETVYGLGANALDPAAVARIFAAKQRPTWDPVIVHVAKPVAGNAMIGQLVTGIPETARKLIAAFWPGPLTLLLPRSAAVPDSVTAGRPLVGVRMPSHPVAFELIRRAGLPIAAPSANTFSRTSPTTAAHVLEDLDGRIDAILDAGPTLHGVFGRRIATLPGYNFSPALKTLDIVWTPETVSRLFEIGPMAYTPGTKMPEQTIGAAEDRNALVKFLEKATAK